MTSFYFNYLFKGLSLLQSHSELLEARISTCEFARAHIFSLWHMYKALECIYVFGNGFTFFFFYKFIFLVLAVLGLRFCARAFSSCGKRGPLFIAVRGPFTIAASLVAEHRLQMRRLSNCGSRAQLLHGMWNLPRPGLEPVSPALADRFSTTVPPGKPGFTFF